MTHHPYRVMPLAAGGDVTDLAGGVLLPDRSGGCRRRNAPVWVVGDSGLSTSSTPPSAPTEKASPLVGLVRELHLGRRT